MKRFKIATAVMCSVLLMGAATVSGCAQRNLTNVVPFVPPAYFSGQLVVPFDLSAIYYSPYSPASEIAKLNGNIYIFKSLKVDKITMDSIAKGYAWVDIVKAYPLNPENLKQLKLGETIDVAGVLAGPCRDFPKSLTFTGVVFLPANSVTLPIGGDTPLQYVPTY